MLTDQQILAGFRCGDSEIIRHYFYGYCREGYHVYDRRYDLKSKENMDCMSLTHQYAIYLLEHDWKPLENKAEGVSLKTWVIGGFRYIILDALKWYQKAYGGMTFEDYLQSFDVTSDLREQFHKTVMDMCKNCQLSPKELIIVHMILEQGFKGREIAAQLGMTPAAVSQHYSQLREKVIVPYFKQNFDMNLDAPEVIDRDEMMEEAAFKGELRFTIPAQNDTEFITCNMMEERRTTPERITSLAPNEIFVFGSNLRGMHGGGAAYAAVKYFGAIMGQGVGLQGQSYAIPTMQGGVETIKPYVDEFIAFALEHKDLTFLVTRIGCGIAGFTDDEIAPLFAAAHDIDNIVLPYGW